MFIQIYSQFIQWLYSHCMFHFLLRWYLALYIKALYIVLFRGPLILYLVEEMYFKYNMIFSFYG